MTFFIAIIEAVVQLSTQLTGSLFSGVPGGGVDCSQWVPPEEFYPGGVWPDGSPIEPGAQCGVERR